MKRIKISVRLVGGLRKYNPKGNYESNLDLIVEQDSTVENILNLLKIPKNLTTIAYIDGKIYNKNESIQPNSALIIFPPIMGG